jgi:molybdenum cofactor synthesis domain-containing protein
MKRKAAARFRLAGELWDDAAGRRRLERLEGELKMPPDTVTASVIIIGNEILSGRTKDANLPFLAERLSGLGIRLREARVVADVEEEIVAAVNACRSRYTYVFTTGGIGPTHDDITAASVAKAFGVVLERNPEAVRRLEAHYQPGRINEARLRMANIPAGARLIDNPVSRAPGFQIDNVFVLPGVPTIMNAMFDGIVPRLVGSAPVLSVTVSCHLPEGQIAADLAGLQARYVDIEIGSYPYYHSSRQFGVSVVLRGTDRERLNQAAADVASMVRRLGGEPVTMLSEA